MNACPKEHQTFKAEVPIPVLLGYLSMVSLQDTGEDHARESPSLRGPWQMVI